MGLNPAWDEEHDLFHATLLSGCRSNWLLRFSHILRDQSSRYRLLAVRQEGELRRDIPAEHKAILDATLARDADQACALLSQHFEETMRLVLKQIE